MKIRSFILPAVLFCAGCGGAMASKSMPSYSAAEYDESGAAPAPSQAPSLDRNMMKDLTEDNSAKKSIDAEPGATSPAEPTVDTPTVGEQMVVYSGYLHLRVRRLLDSVNEITRLTTDKGGYIESFSGNIIIVRIPANDFEGIMETFAKLGDVLDRRIQASDVSEQFTDLSARLKVAEEARNRLLALLNQVQDVKERLAILQEIKRLSEQIETIQSTLATLKNLVDYFTITLQLNPIVDNMVSVARRSPFPWIRGLEAHLQTVPDGSDDFTMTLPSDFVLFDEEDDYRAQSADTTIIRGGVVKNDPSGTSNWWSLAVHYEMTGRGEILEKEGTNGLLNWRLYRNDDIQPRFFLIAVHAEGERLWVVEVNYPDADAFAKHHDAVLKSLSTFKVKP